MDKVIVCDKCKHEGCSVSEVLPESQKISMGDFVKQGKSPYRLDQYAQSEQRDRKWKVSCPECGHTLEYVEYALRTVPYFCTS